MPQNLIPGLRSPQGVRLVAMLSRSVLLMASLLLGARVAAAEDWTQFRGPDGQGHSTETGVPSEWSEEQHVAWKTEIPGLGWSSPVVSKGQVWLTSAEEVRGALRAICVSTATGKVVHNVEVFRKPDLGRISHKNSHASPTPVIDGDQIFVHYGAHGTAALSRDGKVTWRAELPHDHRHGPAGSPVVCGGLLIIACDGADQQYIIALDKKTGIERWKQPRSGEMAYSTPLVYRFDNEDQVVAVGGGAAVAYRPETGEEVWRCRFEGHSVVPRPIFANRLLYFCTGYWTPSLYALRVDGYADVTESHVVGRVHRAVPLTPSPLMVGSEMYMVSDLGILTCIDARNGKELWHKRLGGNFSASPTFADGKIYVVNEEATTTVLAPGKEFKLLATNKLEGRSLASPAISGHAIYLRTDTHLYKIAEPRPAVAAKSKQNASQTAQAE